MNRVYLICLKGLAPAEKVEMRNYFDRWAFMISSYFLHGDWYGLIVYWGEQDGDFEARAMSMSKCNYKEVTGWATDKDHIDQAFFAAFEAQSL